MTFGEVVRRNTTLSVITSVGPEQPVVSRLGIVFVVALFLDAGPLVLKADSTTSKPWLTTLTIVSSQYCCVWFSNMDLKAKFLIWVLVQKVDSMVLTLALIFLV